MPTHYSGTPEEVLALNTFIKLTRGLNAFEDRLFAYGALSGLTTSQFGVLETLYHLGPLCQGVLSRKLLSSAGNITLVLDNLEKQGLVRRVRSTEDRRMIMIELTPDGQRLIAEIFPRHVAAMTAEMSALTRVEQEELGRICRKLGSSKPGPIENASVAGEPEENSRGV